MTCYADKSKWLVDAFSHRDFQKTGLSMFIQYFVNIANIYKELQGTN